MARTIRKEGIDMKKYKILVINPGSTSTKLSLFINEDNVFTLYDVTDGSPSINTKYILMVKMMFFRICVMNMMLMVI